MMKPRELLGFLVLGTVMCLVLGHKPPLFRWGYEVVQCVAGRGKAKPGKDY